MGYKLADGSDNDLYRVGDTFEMVSTRHFKFDAGSIVALTEDDKSHCPYFNGEISITWNKLTPTKETRRKVAERYLPDIKSDYPDWLLSAVKDRVNKAATAVFRKDPGRKDENRKMYRDFDEKCKQLLSERKCFSEIMRDLYKLADIEIDEEKLRKVQSQFDGYVSIIGGRAFKDKNTEPAKTVVNIHVPEPLARIIDWRGGEPHNPTDIIVNDSGETSTLLRAVHLLGKSGWNTLIRINTAAIPKQRIMTVAEVEREFGVKVVY